MQIISLLIVCGCSATTAVYEDLPDEKSEEGLVSIAYLKSLCGYRSTPVVKDITVVGTVVANDLYGAYNKTAVVFDGSAGIEIHIDKLLLYEDYPLFSQIAVFCHGLSLGREGGKIVLGAAPTGEYSVDRISYKDAGLYIHSVSGYPEHSEAARLTIDELSVEHVSAPVRIDNLHFIDVDEHPCWCDSADGEFLDTDHLAADRDGKTVAVRFYGSCVYAGDSVPRSEVSIVGILDYTASGGGFALRPANHGIYFQ